MKALRLILTPLAAVFLGSCLSARDPMETRYFAPSIPLMAGSPGRVLSQTLVVADFRVASHLGGDRIAVRTAPQEIEYYTQHRWAGPLDRLVTEEARKGLRPFFESVSQETSGLPGEVILSGFVEAFEEENEAAVWFGRAAIDLTLRDGGSGAILWRGFFESRKATQARHPQAVARALGEALGEILGQAALEWGKTLPELPDDR